MPPVARSCSPVSHAESPDARKTAIGAMSPTGLIRGERRGVEVLNTSRCAEIEQHFPGRAKSPEILAFTGGGFMRLHKRIVTGIACICLLAGSVRTARAQAVVTSFGELAGKLKPGKTVYVTDDAGRRVKGKLLSLSASSLTLLAGADQETFRETQVRQLTEQRRYTGRGALLGLGIGAGVGAFGVLLTCGDCGDWRLPFALAGAVAYGGIGAGIGAAAGASMTHERLVYGGPAAHAPTTVVLTPIVSKQGKGLAASVRF
jgi:hypothetical protein